MGASREAQAWLRTAGAVLLAGGVATAVLAARPGPVLSSAVVLGVSGAAVAVLVAAAVRGDRPVRLGWVLTAATVALWSAFLWGALHGWDRELVWFGLRGAAAITACLALVAAPGVRRTWREWRLLLLDGWMIGASSLLVSWVSLGLTGSSLRPDGPMAGVAVFVLPLDLAVASVSAGLAVRTSASARPQAVLILLATCVAASADATWATTGSSRLGVAQWLAVPVLLAASALVGDLDVFRSAAPERAQTRLGRISQLAAVPGLLAAIAVPVTDPVVVLLASSLLLALALQLGVLHGHQHDLHAELHEQAGRLDQLVRGSRDAILQVADDGTVEFANEATAEVFGRAPHDLTGRPVLDLLHEDDRRPAAEAVRRLEERGMTSVRVGGRVRYPDGTWHHLEATVSRRRPGPGRPPSGWTASTRDVSERVSLEQELRRQAEPDALTGLTNRQAFVHLVDDRLRRSSAVVLFLDLDGFKTINDTDGHARGDEVLRHAAQVIQEALLPGDVAARLGGDEFAVLLGGLYDEVGPGSPGPLLARGVQLAEQLVRGLATVLPARPGGRSGARGGVSVGVAAAPEADGVSGPGEALLRDADLAMYEAKSRGGGTVVVFEDLMRERVLERTRRQGALERAVQGQGLHLHVQPIVALEDASWVGFEALVRWRDGDRLRGPSDFIPLAEETGLVVPLGTWVLRTALEWLATRPDDAGIAVNVAARQVADPGFGDIVVDALRRSGVDPARLTLEITEQTAVEDLARAGAVLQPLRALGVHVALDDFGTGFSSLGYLAQLPVDELKIDRRFVSGLGVRTEDEALVRAVIGLADDLGLRVVAEGVETQQQARYLAALGCGWAQGYLFSRPTPAEQLVPWPPLARTSQGRRRAV